MSTHAFRSLTVRPSEEDPATTAWVAQVVINGGSVSAGRQTTVNTLIVGLKADGIWTQLDRLWLLAAENTASALTDLVGLTLATEVSSPTFTVDRGYTGDGVSAYINTNFNPTTGTPNYTQNLATVFGWSLTSVATVIIGDNSVNCMIQPRYSDNNAYLLINEGSTPGISSTDATGFWHGNRSASNATQRYKNGSSIGTDTGASLAVVNETKRFLSTGGSQFAAQIACGGYGGSLTATDASNLYTRIRTYMTAVGVP